MQPLITSIKDVVSVRGGLLRILGNALQSRSSLTVHIGTTVVELAFNALEDSIEVQIPILPEYGLLDIFVDIEGHTTSTVKGYIIENLTDLKFPCPVNFTALNYRQNIKRLLPEGQALSYRNGSNIDKVFYASADEQGRFNELVCTLFKELTALTTTELVNEWWAEYGLPGDCLDQNATFTVDAMRDMLLAKLNAQGGQTPQYYIYLASLLGYNVSVVEYISESAYPVLQEGNPMCGSVLYCEDAYFEWGVVVDGRNVGDDLQCMLGTYKPYHTKIRYSSINTPTWWVDDTGDYVIDDSNSRVIIYEGLTRPELDVMIANGDDVTDVDTSGITDFSSLFDGNTVFNQDISGWDTSSVTTMDRMFLGALAFNQDISNWDTSSVIDMSYMFSYATSFNQDISNWDTYSVTNMSYMFYKATSFNQPLSWDTARVTNMGSMFRDIPAFNQPLSFDTYSVTNMSYMFYKATSFNQPLSWDTSSVIDMNGMFNYARSFNQPLSWDTARVIDMSSMFNYAQSFNQPLSFDTSSVIDMNGMFYEARSFNQPLSWDTSSVIDMNGMFEFAVAFNQPLSFDTSSVINMGSMFRIATSFNQDISGWDTSNVTEYAHFHEYSPLTQPNCPPLLW